MTTERHAILVIGDVMLDRLVDGEMTRISPEAAAPIIRQKLFAERPGGAANVAANIAALGRKTYLIGTTGEDYPGKQLAYMLTTQYNVNCCLVRRPDHRTIVKTKVTASGKQVLRVDDEDDVLGGVTSSHNEDVRHALYGLLTEHTDVGLIVVADYAKGTMNRSSIQDLRSLAVQRGIPLFVDTKPDNAHYYSEAQLLKPNLNEARAMCRHMMHPGLADSVAEEDQIPILCQAIRQLYSLGAVIITRGGNGATFYDGQEMFTSSIPRQEVFDVSGAGDTFMAVLADARLAGYSWPDAILRANTAASEAVKHLGTTIVSRDQLEEAVKNRLGSVGKILTRSQAQQYARRQRQNGRRIVLANGCFRFLHHGHWEMLRWAKQQGDVLIMAANSDKSILSLRGEVPYIPETYRAEMFAVIPFVDAVLFFSEDSAEQVVRDLHPDILVKGSEYNNLDPQQVPGADWLAARGGAVLFAPMVPNIHASHLARSISPTC